ncbi:MAG: glycoside hydrolase family 32 protein [Gemmatimonadetes bacterium]|nr:glycoside hydrolase family 32 protein [Gemmatimonadota bacterium]
MRRVLLAASCVLMLAPSLTGAQGRTTAQRAAPLEPFRPRFHFTPERNWMNDPNGMVYYDGEWHLFYQYNPFGDKWGHMSWGHAVSRDLVHWEQLPLALAESDGVMIFSGSAVVDWRNTSGFARDGKPPLVALYTGHRDGHQDQRIAYSNDRGRTWSKGGVVLDLNKADFRDPKVFWHAPSSRWVMTVALSPEYKVQFYTSPDLKRWTRSGEFGPAGSRGGIWECPDLFPVQVEGGGTRWVLIVNLNPGAPAGGSGTQYFVGDFDGQRFVPEGEVAQPLWADYGADFYAGVSWSDVPAADGRRVWLGWMSNWSYAQEVPTSPWRSAMSVARTLTLRRTPAGLRLVQRPVAELERLRRGAPRTFAGGTFTQASAWLAAQRDLPMLLDVEMTFAGASSAAPFALQLTTGPAESLALSIDPANRRIALDRTRSGRVAFHKDFPGVHTAPIRIANGEIQLRLLIDAASLELFAQQGETVMTEIFFPTGDSRALSLSATGTTPRVQQIRIHGLDSAR